jgi:hypothetical protein
MRKAGNVCNGCLSHLMTRHERLIWRASDLLSSRKGMSYPDLWTKLGMHFVQLIHTFLQKG